jgi:hypothetical protein
MDGEIRVLARERTTDPHYREIRKSRRSSIQALRGCELHFTAAIFHTDWQYLICRCSYRPRAEWMCEASPGERPPVRPVDM